MGNSQRPMLKFFRGVRKQLLSENKFSKYLLYAVGEIILVVIGILIALQINNWNEQRKKKDALKNIYRIIAEDLTSDSNEVDIALNFMRDREKLFKKILNDSLTPEIIGKDSLLTTILTDIRVLNIERRGYQLLRSFENTTAAKKDSLSFRIIDFYTSSIFYTEKVENLILDDLIKINDLWKSESWYSNIMRNKPDEDYLNYMLNNLEFKNLCAFRYSLYYNNYEPTIEQFQDGSTRILEAINKRLQNE